MSTNKTQNYQLHAWEPDDDFLRTEFNENFAKLDGSLRLIFGAYKGHHSSNDKTPTRFELGVKPRAVLVSMDYGSAGSGSYSYVGMGFPGLDACGALLMDDTGFSVKNVAQEAILLDSDLRSYYYMVLY